MKRDDNLLSQQCVELLVKSMTCDGSVPLNEIQVERFLNSLTRLQSNVPTGLVHDNRVSDATDDNNKEG